MKRINIIAIILILALAVPVLGACGSGKAGNAGAVNAPAADAESEAEGSGEGEGLDEEAEEGGMIGGVQLANPFTEYSSKEEAEAAAGFTISLPEILPGVAERVWRVMDDGSHKMIELIGYAGGEEVLRIRKAEGSGPVDGDYNTYPVSANATYPFSCVEVRGEEGLAKVISWTQELEGKVFSFAILSSKGLSCSMLGGEGGAGDADLLITKLAEYGVKYDETKPAGSAAADAPSQAGSAPADVPSQEDGGEAEASYAADTLPSSEVGEADQSYSPRTVIISVEPDFSDGQLQSILDKYDLEVLYDYDLFNMYALTASHDLSRAELDALVASLQEEPGVLSAEKDQIITLDDPVGDEPEGGFGIQF